MSMLFEVDMEQYITGRLADRGCNHADKFLNHESKCTQCPFTVCVKSMNWLKCLKLLESGKVYA